MDLSEWTSEELIEELRRRGFVAFPRDVAKLVRKVFLLMNPNRMRVADPRVVDSARAFIAAVEEP